MSKFQSSVSKDYKGKVTTKVVPSDKVLLKEIDPPSPSTIVLVIESPSPVPSCSFV